MSERSVPERRGIARTLTLDDDASELLRQFAPSYRTQGKFVSSLLKAEQARREERQRLRRVLLEALQEEPISP
jgi:hypothetical protein